MRNECHKKNLGQAKEQGGGVEERKNTPSPPPSPPSFFDSSSIFCATETENPIPRLSLVFLHSEVYHMEMHASQATTTAMNLPTAFDSEFLLIMDSQDDL